MGSLAGAGEVQCDGWLVYAQAVASAASGGDERKGRALNDDEIIKVWRTAQAIQDRAASGERTNGAFGAIAQMALLTACRRGELAQLKREHVLTGTAAINDNGIDGERIHLPGSHTKTGESHDVPLTPLMRAVITAQPRGLSPLVFPSRTTGGVVGDWTRAVQRLRRNSGVDFKMHDLRRTCRTLMGCLGGGGCWGTGNRASA